MKGGCLLRHDDLVALWGSDCVYRLAAEAVKDLPIPEEAKEVLTDVGLPRELEWIAFSGDTGVDSPLPTVMSLQGRPAELCRFGSAYDDLWCIELSVGAVLVISEGDPARDRFVNSGLPCFAEFLYEYQRYVNAPQGSSAEERWRVRRLQGRLSAIDPAALADPKSEWSLMLDDLRWEVGLK